MSLRSNYTARTRKWQAGFVTEPTVNGGRVQVENDGNPGAIFTSYAQELAPIPLSMTPTVIQGASSRKWQDIEPYFHTCFCNEVLLQPRILHNCNSKSVVLKVEVREIEWKEGFGYIAHLPQYGPTIHNNRRGPFLVSDSLTTCAVRQSTIEQHFFDEFKIKLPMDLSKTLSLFLTVFHVNLNSETSWKPTREVHVPCAAGDESLCMEQVACGFLPLAKGNCLVDNGIHDVRVIYNAGLAPKELCEQWGWPATSLVLAERKKGTDPLQSVARKDAYNNTSSTSERVSITEEPTAANKESMSLSVSFFC